MSVGKWVVEMWTEEKNKWSPDLENEHVVKKTFFFVSCAIFSLTKKTFVISCDHSLLPFYFSISVAGLYIFIYEIVPQCRSSIHTVYCEVFSPQTFLCVGGGVYKYSPSYEMEMQGLGLRDGNR